MSADLHVGDAPLEDRSTAHIHHGHVQALRHLVDRSAVERARLPSPSSDRHLVAKKGCKRAAANALYRGSCADTPRWPEASLRDLKPNPHRNPTKAAAGECRLNPRCPMPGIEADDFVEAMPVLFHGPHESDGRIEIRLKSEKFQGSRVEDAGGALERKFRDLPGGVSRRPFAAKRKDRFRRDFGEMARARGSTCSSESKA